MYLKNKIKVAIMCILGIGVVGIFHSNNKQVDLMKYEDTPQVKVVRSMNKEAVEKLENFYLDTKEQNKYLMSNIVKVNEVENSDVEEEFVCTNENHDGSCYQCLYDNWDDELKEYAQELCIKYNVPYEYVLGTIWNESKFNSDAYNNGNYGLMQINTVNLNWLNKEVGLNSLDELYDPKKNIECGVFILSYHLESVDNYSDMVLRYQCGEGTFNKLKAQGINSIDTSDRVIKMANLYKNWLEL